jgi:hypothetical protein
MNGTDDGILQPVYLFVDMQTAFQACTALLKIAAALKNSAASVGERLPPLSLFYLHICISALTSIFAPPSPLPLLSAGVHCDHHSRESSYQECDHLCWLQQHERGRQQHSHRGGWACSFSFPAVQLASGAVLEQRYLTAGPVPPAPTDPLTPSPNGVVPTLACMQKGVDVSERRQIAVPAGGVKGQYVIIYTGYLSEVRAQVAKQAEGKTNFFLMLLL